MNAVPVSSTEALICQGTQTMSRLPRVNEREARLLLHRRFRIIGLSVQLFEQRVEGVFEVSHALFERGHASRGLRDGLPERRGQEQEGKCGRHLRRRRSPSLSEIVRPPAASSLLVSFLPLVWLTCGGGSEATPLLVSSWSARDETAPDADEVACGAAAVSAPIWMMSAISFAELTLRFTFCRAVASAPAPTETRASSRARQRAASRPEDVAVVVLRERDGRHGRRSHVLEHQSCSPEGLLPRSSRHRLAVTGSQPTQRSSVPVSQLLPASGDHPVGLKRMNAVPVSSTEALICQGTQTMSRLPRVNEREARLLPTDGSESSVLRAALRAAC